MDNTDQSADLRRAIQVLDAKLDVLRTAFLSLASLYDVQDREQLAQKVESDIQQLLDIGLLKQFHEVYFEDLRRQADRLLTLLSTMKPSGE